MRSRNFLVAVAGMLVLTGGAAIAQDAPDIDTLDEPEVTVTPELTGPSLQDVLGACSAEAGEADCVALTQAYLDALDAQELADDEYSAALADLVAGLGAQSQGADDPALTQAIASSIRLAQTAATDRGLSDQAEQFAAIASTVEEGDDFETAEIADPASPA